MQKGNALLIVLLLVLAVGAGGYYLYTKGGFKMPDVQTGSNYTLSTMNPTSSSGPSENVSTTGSITLSVTSPVSGATLSSGNITVKGKTLPNAEVFINDQSTKADTEGNFSLNLTLDEGENNLVVTANDAEGNVAEQNLSVNIQTF